jgi:hypothetical protein
VSSTPRPSTAAPVSAAIRAVRGDLIGADVGKLARIVAIVDALPVRGDADGLIAPLRQRLATLRVPRPLSFRRLLFVPLDPVLLHGASWRRGAVGVPRTVIGPLGDIVRAGLADAASFDQRLAGRNTDDHAMVVQAGGELWPQAAAILRSASAETDWVAQTGLQVSDFGPLCRVVAAVLEFGPTLCGASHAGSAEAANRADVRALVAATLRLPAAGQAETLATVIAVLLNRLPRPAELLGFFDTEATEAAKPVVSVARNQAVEFVLGRLEIAPAAGPDLRLAAEDVLRRAVMFEELSAWSQHNSNRRAQVEQTRRSADAACRTRFEASLKETLVAPTTLDPATLRAKVEDLEEAARELRRFEHAARHIGSGDFYDRALRQATARLTGPEAGSLSVSDRVRLTELLLGPDAAMALLAAAPAKPLR